MCNLGECLTGSELAGYDVDLHTSLHLGQVGTGHVAKFQLGIGLEQGFLPSTILIHRLDDGVELRPSSVLYETGAVAWLAWARELHP